MNDFITIRFRNMTPSVNSIQMDFHWPLDLNYYHSYILTDDKDIVKVKKHTWMSKTKGYGFELVIPNNKRGVYGVMFYLLEDETFN